MPVVAIHADGQLVSRMPRWDRLSLTTAEILDLPTEWRHKLEEWRGVYYIFDRDSCKGYVGAAYGADNLYARWRNYAETGDGGNKHLVGRDKTQFRFSILQLTAKSASPKRVVRIETQWKRRLHTLHPHGLNGG